MSDDYEKPIPEPTIESKPFWDGLKEGRLLIQRCADCGTLRHYPRPMCSECRSLESDWAEVSGRGTIYSWTETHHPFHIGFRGELPYILATVALEEGVRIQSQVLGASLDQLKVGMPVTTVLVAATDDLVLPYFKLA